MRHFSIILFLLLAACSESRNQSNTVKISATACATTDRDGAIIECEVSEERQKALKDLRTRMERIDAQLPGPDLPDLEQLHVVSAVAENGTIALRNGSQLTLAGLDCDHPDLTRFLRVSFTGSEASKLAYVVIGKNALGVNQAYIWEVDTDFAEDLEIRGEGFGPMVVNVNEVALTSMWGKPVEQDGHLYHERYVQLFKLGRQHAN